jgi:hypothetical protein
VWRLIGEGWFTLEEIETYYSLQDYFDAVECFMAIEDAKARAAKR